MNVVDLSRNLIAILQPLTGARATGSIVLRGATESGTVARGHHLVPVLAGQARHDMPFKVTRSTASDLDWAVTPQGVAVSIASVLGGQRHNLPVGTEFRFDPAIPFLDERRVRLTTALSNATEPTSPDVHLCNAVAFETFGPSQDLDTFRSSIGGRFPAVLVHWLGSEPADGQATSIVSQGTHRGRGRVQFGERFEFVLIVSREDSEAARRGQAVRILDAMTRLLVDRTAVDDLSISSPAGVQVRRRYRIQSGNQQLYRATQMYGLEVAVSNTVVQTDDRTFSPWLFTVMDVPRHEPEGETPSKRILPVVDDVRIDMTPE